VKNNFPGFATRLESLIKGRGISKKDFAESLGVGPSAVTGWLNGNINPSKSIIKLISYAYSVNETWLLTGEGRMFRSDERPSQKRFNFSDKLSDKEKQDLLRMIDSDDGIGRVLYTLLNHRREERPVEEERRQS